MIQDQSLKLAVLPHFEINTSVPANIITAFAVNMKTV
jgi:hypothetical protein